MFRRLLLFLFFAAFLTGFVYAQTEGEITEGSVYIPDENLKTAIEIALGVSDPNQTDMLKLTELRAEDCFITDLTGLEYATNLTKLFLEENKLTSFPAEIGKL
ncbi:MAG: hypothetical protein ACYSOZ_04165, partial [Planctomycetota bacterium]